MGEDQELECSIWHLSNESSPADIMRMISGAYYLDFIVLPVPLVLKLKQLNYYVLQSITYNLEHNLEHMDFEYSKFYYVVLFSHLPLTEK